MNSLSYYIYRKIKITINYQEGKTLDISNYSFSQNKAKPKIGLKKHMWKILIIVFLLLSFFGLLIFYSGLKHHKKNVPTGYPEGSFLAQVSGYLENGYGYDFHIYVTGGGQEMLGSFLGPYFEGSDFAIRGTVFSSGAEFTVYREADGEIPALEVSGIINTDGTYISTSALDIYKGEKNAIKMIRVFDGMRGEDVFPAVMDAFKNGLGDGSVEQKETTDGLPAIQTEGFSQIPENPAGCFLQLLSGPSALSFQTEKDENGTDSAIVLCQGDAVSFRLTVTVNNLYHKSPAAVGSMDLDEYLAAAHSYEQAVPEETVK